MDSAETQGNLTNLAIKGIVGIAAMAEISRTLNQSSDAQYYTVRSRCSAADQSAHSMFRMCPLSTPPNGRPKLCHQIESTFSRVLGTKTTPGR